MAAGEEFSLFGWGRVADKREQVGFDASKIQKGVAFGGGSVGGDFFSSSLLLEEKSQEVVFHLFGAGLERTVCFESEKSGVFFLGENPGHSGLGLAGGGSVATIDPKAATVGGVFFHIPNLEPGVLENPRDGVEREVRKMLVVDGIELILGDQTHEVRKLQRDGAARLKRGLQPSGEIVYVRHMGEDIVTDYQVGLATVGGQFVAKPLAEKLAEHGDSNGLGGCRGACGGFYPKARNAGGEEVFQKVAIVGGDLDHLAGWSEAETGRDHFRIALGVLEPRSRGAGEVGVVGIEKFSGIRVILGLHKPALVADQHAERVVFFRLHQILGREVSVRRRREAEIEEQVLQRG